MVTDFKMVVITTVSKFGWNRVLILHIMLKITPHFGKPSKVVSKPHLENHAYLQAIATGAVFMGANTYIGNAPNFMVKSIAEESGVEMPSFFGYIFRYSLPVLIPVFVIATWVFFE